MRKASASAAALAPRLDSAASHQVRALRVRGGFLDGVDVTLASGLNCLIGARGTGKTTLLELVRYVLDDLPPASDPERRRIEGLVEANLGAGGIIELAIQTRDGLPYTVSRRAGDAPQVTTTDGQPVAISIGSGGVFKADIYSQNQIERIAAEPPEQLALIDSFAADRIAAVQAQLAEVGAQLAQNTVTAQPLQGQIETLADEVATLPTVLEALAKLPPVEGADAATVTAAQQAKALRQREATALDELWGVLQEHAHDLQERQGQLAKAIAKKLTQQMLSGPNGQQMLAIRDMLLNTARDVDAELAGALRAIESAQGSLRELGRDLAERHGEQDVACRELMVQHEALRGQAEERAKWEGLKAQLLTKQGDLADLVARRKALQDERAQLVQRLSELRDERFRIRQQIAADITERLAPAVQVTIEQAGQRSTYQARLEESLRNQRMRHGVVAQRIASALPPAELVQLIHAGDVACLRQRAGLNDDQARRTVDALRGSDVLPELETIELADRPRIELRDGSSYKPTTSLSTGQKCTAILPILLLESDRPLFVDQPEDNLDNRFICQSVVESIRQVKARRQLVFVTHNPNIPVLGEAEHVIVLESDGAHAQVVAEGDVDTCREPIVNLLEGGEEAFRQRQERYAYA